MQQEPWAEPLLLLPSRSPVRIHSVQDGLELRVGLPFLHHGQVIAQGAQTGFELLVVQPAGLVLVEVFEHHAEFFEGLLSYSNICLLTGVRVNFTENFLYMMS